MVKLFFILGIVLFAGCVSPDKPVKEEQPTSTPALTEQPTSTIAPPAEENIPKIPTCFLKFTCSLQTVLPKNVLNYGQL